MPKLIKSVFIFIAITLILGCSSKNNIGVDGKLLISGAFDVSDNESLLQIDLNDGSIKESELFDDEAISIPRYYPVFNYGELFFISYEEEIYSICSVDNEGQINKVVSSQEKIASFNFNQDVVVYIVKKDDESASLYKYDRVTEQIEELYQGVDSDSRPDFTESKDIMFVTEAGEQYNVVVINNQGDVSHLIDGRFPISLSDGEIIYQNSTSLYRLKDTKSYLLKKGIHLLATPILSLNKEWMVFFHWTTQYDVSQDTLSLMSLSNKKMQSIQSYNQIHLKTNGATWID